ncbi:MAG: hypothetical protein KME35_08020 [Aphanocapsa sp. GSE-SYN-MK-11-07L]|jgi:hypothetical protein|nr:hypothetical protein [Aphanocapsa sp. GSE-SYN-MK-11-07L]
MSRSSQAETAKHKDAVILLAIAFNQVCKENARLLDVPLVQVQASLLRRANEFASIASSQEKVELLQSLWQLMDSVLPPDELA